MAYRSGEAENFNKLEDELTATKQQFGHNYKPESMNKVLFLLTCVN